MSLTPAQLNAGDVFLYRGTGILSHLIRFFDASEVNHAGLYLGGAEGEGGSVGEAIGIGVVQRTIESSIAGSDRVIARRLTGPVATLDPVLTRASSILSQGHRYGFEQIALLAFLSLTRRLKAAPVLKSLLRRTLDAAATWVTQLTSGGSKREPMICSEFVFRAYDEALPDANDVYTLDIDMATPRALRRGREPPPDTTRGHGIEAGSLLDLVSARAVRAAAPLPVVPPTEPVEMLAELYLQQVTTARSAERLASLDLAELLPDVERFARAWQAATEPPAVAGTRGPVTALEQLTRTAADFVTPGDLLKTTSLFTVGDVKP